MELRRPLVEHRPELAVREEGTIRRNRVVPAEKREICRRLAVRLNLDLASVEVRAGGPSARDARLAAVPFDSKHRFDRGVGMVEVAPALAPDGRPLRPAPVVLGEQHFERLGEARLPGAVAADDEGQARARRQFERSAQAHAAEALDRDRCDVCPDRLEFGAGVLEGTREQAVLDERLDGVTSVEGR